MNSQRATTTIEPALTSGGESTVTLSNDAALVNKLLRNKPNFAPNVAGSFTR